MPADCHNRRACAALTIRCCCLPLPLQGIVMPSLGAAFGKLVEFLKFMFAAGGFVLLCLMYLNGMS